MFSGPMTLACLLLAAQTGDPETYFMRVRDLNIPIKIPANGLEIRQLQLYVSMDQGNSWGLRGRTTPDRQGFPFKAEQDGTYWFKLVTIPKKDTTDPPIVDQSQWPVSYIIVVDTTLPEVRLADPVRNGDTIKVQWAIKEDYPDPKTFKVEYRTADLTTDLWKPVPEAVAGPTGEVSFKPGSNAQVTVRVSVSDKAGNRGQQIKEVPGTVQGLLAGSGPQGTVDVPLNVTPPPPGGNGGQLPPVPNPSGDGQQQGVVQTSTTNSSGNTLPPITPLNNPPPPPGPLPSPVQNTLPPTETLAQTGGVQAPGVGAMPPHTPVAGLPPVVYTHKAALRLEFEVAKVGPSGLGGVDVYQTLDDGRTWIPCKITPADVVLPLLGDAQKDINPRGSVTVQLPREEVVYGFYLVVKNGALNGKVGPQPGIDLPQFRVELDTRLPWAQLSKSTKPHPTRHDVVTLYWEARDRNLSATPITLEWSDRRDGGWTFIGAPELPNTPSQIEWQVPQGLPPKVYLRLTVRDLAGNVTVVQRDEPVLIDLSVPEARIVGFSPAGRQ